MGTNLSNQYVTLEVKDRLGTLVHTQEIPGALIGQMIVSWGIAHGADNFYKIDIKDSAGTVIDSF